MALRIRPSKAHQQELPLKVQPEGKRKSEAMFCSGLNRGSGILSFFRTRRLASCVVALLILVIVSYRVAIVGRQRLVLQLTHPPPMAPEPRRAFATLHTDSNDCYDMALLVFLTSWKATNSIYPMLVLHSTPLPPRVTQLIEQHPEDIRAVHVAEQRSYVVINPRWRKCATKFAIWAETDYDQVAYFDSDHIFTHNVDNVLFVDGRSEVVYAYYERNSNDSFNAGKLLIRPSAAFYSTLQQLYNHRLWNMGVRDMVEDGEQRFLNAVFSGKWYPLPKNAMLPRHQKVWKLATLDTSSNFTRIMAREYIDSLGLRDELKRCMQTLIAYGQYRRERGSVKYWFN